MNEAIMDQSGYVRLYRKLLENPVWTQLSPAVLKVLIAFLLKANWKPAIWYDGSVEVQIPRGSFITSYDKMAKFCNLTPKQVRGAFDHLEKLGFATYTRAIKWTMVTVLNYRTYQSPAEPEGRVTAQPGQGKGRQTGKDEGTPSKAPKFLVGSNLETVDSTQGQAEGQAEILRQGTKRATIEEVKNIYTPPYPPQGDGAGAPLVLVPPDPNGTARQSASKQKPYRDALEEVAQSTHARHPNAHGRRDLSLSAVEKKLEAILKHKRIPATDCEAYLRRIDRNHAAACESEGWRKEDGQFVKSLRNYLAPTEERYDVEPARAARKEPARLMA